MSLFVLEIGSEELPARFLPTQENELHTRFATVLQEAGIAYDRIHVMSTPRRAVVFIYDIQPLQQEREEILTGPPVRAAYDATGNPTKALEGFMRTHGVDTHDIFTQHTDKGEYSAVRKHSGGARTVDVLAHICPAIICAQPFAKRMRWGAHTLAYARPLRWILALFDAEIVPFAVGPVTSHRITWGHRIHGKGTQGDGLLPVASAQVYLDVVRTQAGIEPDASVRRKHIIEAGDALAAQVSGRILWKESLLDEVQGLCEHPVPLLGNFDPSFLEVPREVLLTSMESHQKSFGVEDANGTLLPHFLTVLNITPQDTSLVGKGWERVLRARLEDARFFWHSDSATPLETWLTKLDSITFLAPLGSMGDKTRRLEQLTAWLAHQFLHFALVEDAVQAGRYAKIDIVSHMVGEFDTLQGIMGGIYTKNAGINNIIAQAIAEQYLPNGAESALPESYLGGFLSIADKLDTLVGCFGLKMMPTGTSDPYALRRAALGIARIMLEGGYEFGMRDGIRQAFSLYSANISWKLAPKALEDTLMEFFTARVKNLFISKGYETLHVEAICKKEVPKTLSDAQKRLEALKIFALDPAFTACMQVCKRVTNLVKKGNDLTGVINTSILVEQAEKDMVNAVNIFQKNVRQQIKDNEYNEVFSKILTLRPALDAFFGNVMVMCDDVTLRQNRLNILYIVAQCLDDVADFSALQV